eukprot:TRINITY_DN1179_c0_g1_i1.p1 TRINITY_DN1179_c0_g1~~TRINITY_DN1179_c0_g1_i1.p1  ORF type:complete len:145 (-),score=27.16 TRINITY_DN1179_c0_g1_i1:28-462(-)
MLPADECARAIVKLSCSWGSKYHLYNKDKSMTLPQISQTLVNLGFDVSEIPFQEWKKKLTEKLHDKEDNANALLPLLSYFDVGFPSLNNYVAPLTHQKLSEHEQWPKQITEEILRKYMDFFVDAGLIKGGRKGGKASRVEEDRI